MGFAPISEHKNANVRVSRSVFLKQGVYFLLILITFFFLLKYFHSILTELCKKKLVYKMIFCALLNLWTSSSYIRIYLCKIRASLLLVNGQFNAVDLFSSSSSSSIFLPIYGYRKAFFIIFSRLVSTIYSTRHFSIHKKYLNIFVICIKRKSRRKKCAGIIFLKFDTHLHVFISHNFDYKFS